MGLADSAWPCLGYDTRHTGQSQYIGSQSNTLKWSYKTGDNVFSSPVIGPDGTIYIGNLDKKIYALNPDVTLKWSYQTDSSVASSPYIGNHDRKVYAINPEDGSIKWSFQTGCCIIPSPAISADGTIYVGSAYIFAINSNGSLKWIYDPPYPIPQGCSIDIISSHRPLI